MTEIFVEFSGNKAETETKLLSLEGNQAFLHQELSLFVTELKEKARQAGLEEDSLIPQSGKEK